MQIFIVPILNLNKLILLIFKKAFLIIIGLASACSEYIVEMLKKEHAQTIIHSYIHICTWKPKSAPLFWTDERLSHSVWRKTQQKDYTYTHVSARTHIPFKFHINISGKRL